MIRRIIHERQGLPVPTTRELPVANSKEASALLTSEAISLPSARSKKRTLRWVLILAAIVTFVIAIQANVINLKNALIGVVAVITLMPALRRFRNR